MAIDPLTGQFISGRRINITLRINEMDAVFGDIPDKKWRVELPQFAGKTFYVKDSMPDRTIGIVLLTIGD
jgi:hypothetical protein